MKKLIALVLALALVFAVAVASAATINIESTSSTAEAQTETTSYTYYRIFDASILSSGTVNEDTGALTKAGVVSYSIPSSSATLATNVDSLKVGDDDLFTVTLSGDGTKYIVSLNAHDPAFTGEQIANALNVAKIKDNNLATGSFAQTTPGGTASKTDLAPGYYLILSSLGTKLAVQTLDTVTIKEKNEYFTNTKTEDKANVSVGDVVTYTITVHIPATVAVGDEITVHDTLDDRLSITGTIQATIDGDASKPVTLTDGTKDNTSEDFAKKFTVTEPMLTNDVIISYEATVLNTALSDTKFINSSFANDSHYKTVPSEVKTYTFDFNLNKTFTGATGTASDYTAEFELFDSTGTKLKFVQNVKNDDNDEMNPLKYTYDPAGSITKLTIHHGETINVKGLKAGTYTLKEISTKAGYNLMTDNITVTITDKTPADQKLTTTTPSHEVTYKIGNADTATGTVNVVNNQGTTLPSTGGIGTTIFYILGGLLVVGAAVILVARRKASN